MRWLMNDYEAPVCPSCGHDEYAQYTGQSGAGQPTGGLSMNMAIAGLLINLIVLPGLGTIVGGQKKQGYWQVALFLVAVALAVSGINFFVVLGVWIWVLVTSIEIINQARRERYHAHLNSRGLKAR